MDRTNERQDGSDAPRSERGQPDWDADLHPDRGAGQNHGRAPSDRELMIPTAFDVKDVHRALREFNDEELKQIPILPEGTRLQQGATYVDLAAPRREEVKYNAGKQVEANELFVPKDRVPYWIWNRLIGEPKPGQE
jgi:hypothetical protein